MIWRSKFGRVLILALAVGLGVPLTANATFTLTLRSHRDDGTIARQEIWTDGVGNARDGLIAVNVSNFDGFSFQGNIATSNAPNHGNGPGLLTLSQVSIRSFRSVGIGHLTITVEDDGFYGPDGPNVDVTTRLLALEMSDLQGQADITMRSYMNGSSVDGGVYLNQSGQGSSSGRATIGDRYRLSSVTTINMGRGGIMLSTGSTEVTQALSPVPAPATAIMVLAGAPVLGAFGWLRRRVRTAAAPTT